MKKEKILFLYPPTVYANHSMFKHFTYFGETIDVISRYCKNISVLDCAVEQIEQKVIFNNHKKAIQKVYNMLKPNGYIIYADLTGWRLDRKLEQQLLCNKKSIKQAFENCGFMTIECFDGGPYIEKDNQDNFAFYKQTYYIGKRKER